MMIVLCLLPLLAQAPDSALVQARLAAARLPDTAAARRAGFRPLAVGSVTDLTPFQGQHWLMPARIRAGGDRLDQPSFVMFLPTSSAMRPVGLAYSRRIGHDDPVPDRLGDAVAPWHLHQLCLATPGEGTVLADGVDDCRARGGHPTPRQLAMVHAWTGIPSPDGPYSHDNVALPYLATGLTPPTAAELHGPDGARRARALGLALGETYGARMPFARRVERLSRGREGAALEAHRAAIRALVPELARAQAEHDPPRWNAVTDRAVAEWEALRRIYDGLAPNPETRHELDRQQRMALGEGMAGHHH
jgi:hypothetical protein